MKLVHFHTARAVRSRHPWAEFASPRPSDEEDNIYNNVLSGWGGVPSSRRSNSSGGSMASQSIATSMATSNMDAVQVTLGPKILCPHAPTVLEQATLKEARERKHNEKLVGAIELAAGGKIEDFKKATEVGECSKLHIIIHSLQSGPDVLTVHVSFRPGPCIPRSLMC